MPPKSKAQKQSAKMLAARWSQKKKDDKELQRPIDFDEKVDADAMVLANIFTGQGYADQRKSLLIQNKQPVSESTYYRHQQAICNKIVDAVQNQCAEYAANIEDGTTLGTDGCWNHPRNGTACTVTVFDQHQEKVVAFSNVQKQCNKEEGNYEGSSNLMESVGIERCFQSLKNHLDGKKFILKHDHDNKTHKTVESVIGRSVEERLDPIHATKEIKRKCTAFFSSYIQMRHDEEYAKQLAEVEQISEEEVKQRIKKKGRRPNGIITKSAVEKRYSLLQGKLVAWFQYLAYNVDEEELREKLWHNSARHFIGDHSHCIHFDTKTRIGRPPKKHSHEYWVWEWAVNDESYYHELEEFLAVTTPLIKKVTKTTTQDNESINSKIAHYRDKDANFTVSNESRAAAAIGCKNDVHFESNIISEILKERISQKAIDTLFEDEEKRDAKNAQRRLKHELEKRNFNRHQKRIRERAKWVSNYGYKDKEWEKVKFQGIPFKSWQKQ